MSEQKSITTADSIYTGILTKKRSRSSTLSVRTLAVEAESDRGRLVFSAPFRRLQQKAQVFSLEANAAVRSRLTHSIEVAQIGRFIADQIVENLLGKNLIDAAQSRAFVTFVEVACLMHDLGNPPFGHFGEAAIADWFRSKGFLALTAAGQASGIDFSRSDKEEALADFVEFDGNCQGLRIASILQWNDDPYGLNLTYTSLASYLKYLRRPDFNVSIAVKERPFQKKAGFFSTEEPLVKEIWAHFGINSDNPRRFPLAYVMEAADDIAYCISDLEDSIEKELLVADRVFSDLLGKWNSQELNGADTLASNITEILQKAATVGSSPASRFTAFRTSLSRALSEAASEEYCNRHESILAGQPEGLIPSHSAGGKFLDILKNYCREKVYQHPSIERKELAGLTAVRGLLEHFNCLLECSSERFVASLNQAKKDNAGVNILVERKLLSLFPDRYKQAYNHSVLALDKLQLTPEKKRLKEWNLRAHLVTDFISGMTDDFALWSYQMLSGIRTS